MARRVAATLSGGRPGAAGAGPAPAGSAPAAPGAPSAIDRIVHNALNVASNIARTATTVAKLLTDFTMYATVERRDVPADSPVRTYRMKMRWKRGATLLTSELLIEKEFPPQQGRTFVEYSLDKQNAVLSGEKVGGKFVPMHCVPSSRLRFLQRGVGTDAVEMEDSRALVSSSGAARCDKCNKLFTLVFAKTSYLVLAVAAEGYPRVLLSRDNKITVERIDSGNTFTLPKLDTSLCAPKDITKLEKAIGAAAPPSEAVPGAAGPRSAALMEVAAAVAHSRNMMALQARMEARERSFAQAGSYTCQTMVGDGRCDPECNNAANGFDGGDCCRGLCKDGRRFPCGANGYQCVDRSKAKPCLFIHGLGQKGPPAPEVIQFISRSPGESKPYFGNASEFLDGLCTVTYAWMNTVDKPWTDKPLQAALYAKASQVHNAGGVVFAHSMGNVILAGACLQQNLCGVPWVALAGPIRGSKLADLSADILGPLGFSNTATRSLTYKSFAMRDDPASATANAMSRIIQEKRLYSAVACGVSAWGSGGLNGAKYKAAGIAAFGAFRRIEGAPWWSVNGWEVTPTDGAVLEDDCNRYADKNKKEFFQLATPADSLTALSARFDCNHADMALVNGNVDGIVSYVRNMAAKRILRA